MTEVGGAVTASRGLVPETGEARVNGIRLAYRRWTGPAVARYPAVVLLHGLLQSGEGMANLAAHLARNGPVVVPDLRGRGESDQPDGPEADYGPATMADDVAGLIEALGLDRPVAIGRLHGGLVAYHLAARRPELVRGVVLGDTAPEVDAARAERALATVRALPPRFASLDEAMAFYQERLGLSEARARHDLPHDLVGDGDGYRWRHNLALVERIEAASMPRADWETLARVRCPALLLRGQRGEVPPTTAARFCEVVVGCRVQTVLGARHDVFLGPGAEQAFGAIDLFLLRLRHAPIDADPTLAGAAADAQLPLPGAEVGAVAPTEGDDAPGGGAAIVERLVRAINGRDEAALAALFAADGRVVQYRPEGKVREGGGEAAHAAFRDVFADLPGGVMTAAEVVAAGDRVARVLTVRDAAGGAATADPPPDLAILAPVFLRLREGRIVEFASYGLRLPANEV